MQYQQERVCTVYVSYRVCGWSHTEKRVQRTIMIVSVVSLVVVPYKCQDSVIAYKRKHLTTAD